MGPVKAARLEYFPNPVQNELTIKSMDVINQLCVYSEQGQIVQLSFPYTTNYFLEMGQLVAGLYFVRIQTPSNSFTLKIIRQ